jgi:hypothetical protein
MGPDQQQSRKPPTAGQPCHRLWLMHLRKPTWCHCTVQHRWRSQQSRAALRQRKTRKTARHRDRSCHDDRMRRLPKRNCPHEQAARCVLVLEGQSNLLDMCDRRPPTSASRGHIIDEIATRNCVLYICYEGPRRTSMLLIARQAPVLECLACTADRPADLLLVR